MDGMLPPWLYELLGVPPRKTPSELAAEARQGYLPKPKTIPQEDFLAAPVTDTERQILGLAPRGMLYDLNKQGLDRELNAARMWRAVQRAKPRAM